MVNIGFALLAKVLFVNISFAFKSSSFHLSFSRKHTHTASVFNGRNGQTDLQCNNKFQLACFTVY